MLIVLDESCWVFGVISDLCDVLDVVVGFFGGTNVIYYYSFVIVIGVVTFSLVLSLLCLRVGRIL